MLLGTRDVTPSDTALERFGIGPVDLCSYGSGGTEVRQILTGRHLYWTSKPWGRRRCAFRIPPTRLPRTSTRTPTEGHSPVDWIKATYVVSSWWWGYGESPRSSTPWDRRRAVVSHCSSRFSISTADRPVCRAATAVDPEPANTSSTVPPGGQA